jgi:molybdate transport system substrate-binding protein
MNDGAEFRGRWLVPVIGALLWLVVACGGGSASSESTSGAETGDGVGGTVLVFAAASLTDVMADFEAGFEVAHPGVDVEINVAGSSSLGEQILEGAPADVFASANEITMDRLMAEGAVVDPPSAFAANRLQIAVPVDNPGGITGLADFADDSLLLGLCIETVPCGDFARQALTKAGIEPSIDTEEPDVRALLAKVASGELDGGVVYETDILAASDTVAGVVIQPADNVEAVYPIAVLVDAPNQIGAREFVAFVLSEGGRDILDRYGFREP